MQEFLLIMPEIVIALTLVLVVLGEITYYGERIRLSTAVSLVGLSAAFVQTIISYNFGKMTIFSGVLSIDGFSLFFKLFFISLAGLTVASVSHSQEIAYERRTEYCSLVLACTLTMCFVASAADLVLAFLSVLSMNVISYFLSAFGKRSVLSTEAAVKSMTFGAVAGAFLLYAFAILFASTHSLNIYEMHKFLTETSMAHSGLLVVFILSFLALSFQFGAFPMYLVFPDILEGAPTPVSAFLTLGPRAAGLAFAIRYLLIVFAQPGASPGNWAVLGPLDWTQIISIVSGLTMIIGALLAFRQEGAKRLVSYLIVAETGFLLMGLLVLDEIGIAAILYNLVIELFSVMGIFYVLAFMIGEIRSDQLSCLRGMLKRAVPECVCFIIFLLCLVGSPPLPGFIGKFTLIGVAIRHRWILLAIISVVSMVLTTAAVARLSFHLIGDFQNNTDPPVIRRSARQLFLAALMIPMVLVGVFANQVFSWAGQSLGFILW